METRTTIHYRHDVTRRSGYEIYVDALPDGRDFVINFGAAGCAVVINFDQLNTLLMKGATMRESYLRLMKGGDE